LLASHLDTNCDGCAGNDRGIVVLRVGDIEAALNGRHGDVADRRADIKGRQVCPGAPWVIKDLTGFTDRKRSDPPLTPNPDQRAFEFQ
jgi:hypothetical protein